MLIKNHDIKKSGISGLVATISLILFVIITLIALNFNAVFQGSKKLSSDIKLYKETALSKQKLVNEIINLNSRVKNLLVMHLVTDNNDLMKVYEKEFDALILRAEDNYSLMEAMLQSEQEKSILYNLNRFKKRYSSQREYFVNLSKNNLKTDAKAFYSHSLFYSFSLYRIQLENLADYVDRSSANYYDTLKVRINESYNTIKRISLLGILMVISLILIGLKTLNKLYKSNKELNNLLEQKEIAEQKIKELNEGLELKVIERTLALETTHNELNQQLDAVNNSAIVSITDENGDITFVNDMFCRISGYSREEVLGRNHRFLKSGNQPDGLFVGMWAALKKGLTWRGELQNKAKNGDYYWVQTTIMPFKDTSGKTTKYVAIRFDITTQKEQQRILQEQADKLSQQAEELRVQQEELHEANTILSAQTKKLLASEEELKMQQEELMSSNQELEEKGQMLTEKNLLINKKNEELNKVARELNKKADELELSSKYKSEFLANMSHELRTPLNSILLLSKLLSENNEGSLSPDEVEYAKVINSSGNGLLELINEILDLSKIEAGKMELHKENIPISYICKNTQNIFKPLAINKGIEYNVVINPGVPEDIFTDRIRIEQVLKNLISNAIKFTEKGFVRLTIYTPTTDDIINAKLPKGNYLAFEVQDTGIGIAPEKLEHIFEAFQQADGSTQRKYGGTGLGLAISRELAHLLQGEIKLTSIVGSGSTFTFILPASEITISPENEKTYPTNEIGNSNHSQIKELTNSDKVEIKNAYISDKALDNKNILIVDDDQRNIYSIQQLLQKHNINIKTASNGKEALNIMNQSSNFDLVLMDMMMPEMDGYETVKELRKQQQWQQLPIIALTAKVMKGDKEKCLQAGVSDYLTKPFIGEQLISLIRVWLYK